jgi:hypothetical protein
MKVVLNAKRLSFITARLIFNVLNVRNLSPGFRRDVLRSSGILVSIV